MQKAYIRYQRENKCWNAYEQEQVSFGELEDNVKSRLDSFRGIKLLCALDQVSWSKVRWQLSNIITKLKTELKLWRRSSLEGDDHQTWEEQRIQNKRNAKAKTWPSQGGQNTTIRQIRPG